MDSVGALWAWIGGLNVKAEVVLAIVGLVAGFFYFFIGELKNPRSRQWIMNLVESPNRWRAYRHGVKKLLQIADLFYEHRKDGDGTLLYGRHALSRSIVLASIYPIVIFIVSWLLFGNFKFAGFNFSDTNIGIFERLLSVFIQILLFLIFIVVLVRKSGGLTLPATLGQKIYLTILRKTNKERFAKFSKLANEAAIGLIIGGIGLIYYEASKQLGAGSIAYAFAVCGIFFSGSIVTQQATLTNALSLGIIVSVAGNELLALLIFLLLLPLTNAVADWVSLHLTRRLLGGWLWPENSTHGPKASGIFWRLSLDILVAIGTLILLVFLLGITFELCNFFLSDPLDWFDEARRAHADPLGDGLPITLMLLSTLLPTLFHVVAGSFALLMVPAPSLGRVWRWAFAVDATPAAPDDPHDEPFHLGNKIKSAFALALVLGVTVFVVAFVLHRLLLVFGVIAGETLPLAGLTGIENLPDLLLWIAESVHGWFN